MKKLLLLVMAVALVGCGDSPTPIKDAWEEDAHTCFFCKEEVKLGAFKCKHCTFDPYNGKEKLRALHRVTARGELDEDSYYNQGGITESHRGGYSRVHI